MVCPSANFFSFMRKIAEFASLLFGLLQLGKSEPGGAVSLVHWTLVWIALIHPFGISESACGTCILGFVFSTCRYNSV